MTGASQDQRLEHFVNQALDRLRLAGTFDQLRREIVDRLQKCEELTKLKEAATYLAENSQALAQAKEMKTRGGFPARDAVFREVKEELDRNLENRIRSVIERSLVADHAWRDTVGAAVCRAFKEPPPAPPQPPPVVVTPTPRPAQRPAQVPVPKLLAMPVIGQDKGRVTLNAGDGEADSTPQPNEDASASPKRSQPPYQPSEPALPLITPLISQSSSATPITPSGGKSSNGLLSKSERRTSTSTPIGKKIAPSQTPSTPTPTPSPSSSLLPPSIPASSPSILVPISPIHPDTPSAKSKPQPSKDESDDELGLGLDLDDTPKPSPRPVSRVNVATEREQRRRSGRKPMPIVVSPQPESDDDSDDLGLGLGLVDDLGLPPTVESGQPPASEDKDKDKDKAPEAIKDTPKEISKDSGSGQIGKDSEAGAQSSSEDEALTARTKQIASTFFGQSSDSESASDSDSGGKGKTNSKGKGTSESKPKPKAPVSEHESKMVLQAVFGASSDEEEEDQKGKRSGGGRGRGRPPGSSKKRKADDTGTETTPKSAKRRAGRPEDGDGEDDAKDAEDQEKERELELERERERERERARMAEQATLFLNQNAAPGKRVRKPSARLLAQFDS